MEDGEQTQRELFYHASFIRRQVCWARGYGIRGGTDVAQRTRERKVDLLVILGSVVNVA